MKKFSKLTIVFLFSLGCSAEADIESTDTSKDVTLVDTSKEDVSNDVGVQEDLEVQKQCAGLQQDECIKEATCDWYMMQEVSFENNVCVAGQKVDKCAPNSGTGALEVYIDSETKAAIVSPIGGFGDSWGNWKGCDTNQVDPVCACSGCLDSEPGECDI